MTLAVANQSIYTTDTATLAPLGPSLQEQGKSGGTQQHAAVVVINYYYCIALTGIWPSRP